MNINGHNIFILHYTNKVLKNAVVMGFISLKKELHIVCAAVLPVETTVTLCQHFSRWSLRTR